MPECQFGNCEFKILLRAGLFSFSFQPAFFNQIPLGSALALQLLMWELKMVFLQYCKWQAALKIFTKTSWRSCCLLMIPWQSFKVMTVLFTKNMIHSHDSLPTLTVSNNGWALYELIFFIAYSPNKLALLPSTPALGSLINLVLLNVTHKVSRVMKVGQTKW